MYNNLHKYKRFIFLLIKLAIVIGALYFLFRQLANNELLSVSQLKQQISVLFSKNIWLILLLLLFTDVNWILEMFKWKTLVSFEKKITFFEAFEQSLASLTASLMTPNRIGEYGAKALYFEKKQRKKVMVLNLIGNLSQLAATVFFGIFGMAFFLINFSFKMPEINFQKILLLFSFIFMLILFRTVLGITNFFEKYYSKIHRYLNVLPTTIYIKTIGFSFLRYLVFSHQFYLLLQIFQVEVDYFTLMNLIFSTYFIASVIPSLAIFDWVIKGSVAVVVFGFIGINPLTIVTVTTLMWLLNFALPALLGSIFVLNFKMIAEK